MGKQIVIIGLAVAAVAGIVIAGKKTEGGSGYLPGDVDGNGVVDSKDYAHVMKMMLGLPNPDTGLPYADDWIERADVNGDGEVDMADVIVIEQIMAANS